MKRGCEDGATLAPLFNWRSAVASNRGPKNPTTRHVLLTLSLYMSQKGDSCFPSTRQLEEDTGLTRRTVEKHLRKADGVWLERRVAGMGGQGWKRYEYRARFPDGWEGEGGEPPSPRSDERGGEARSPRSPEGGESNAEGGESDDVKVGNLLPTNSPGNSPSNSPGETTDDPGGSPAEGGRGEVIPLRPQPGKSGEEEGEATPLRLLAETDPDERGKVVARTLGAWISVYPGEVPGAQKGKQGAVAKRFGEGYDPREIALILWGMQFLYPYSEGAAWDLFDAERKAAKALAEARMAIQNGGSRSDADRRVQREAESLAERLRKRKQERGA